MAHDDPRLFQIAALSTLLGYGVFALDFEVEVGRAGAIVGAALLTQLLCTRLWHLPRFDPRSALISGLSLSLLLRTNDLGMALAAAAIAIASKFLIRRGGKHVFNPTCLALVVSLALSDSTWVSAGQWGAAAVLAFGVVGLGQLVVHRSRRSDVTWAFIASYAALRFGRSLWLGEPLQIPLHGMCNGALLLFAFFMISDPRTTPDSRPGRILFAAVVAMGAVFVQFGLFRNNGLLWSLACSAPLVPLFDRFFPAERFRWSRRTSTRSLAFEKEKTVTRSNRPLVSIPRAALLVLPLLLLLQSPAQAFCGFYVAKADTKLFNRASQVVMARDGDRTVITMSNDFEGDPTEFAMVIPVPTFVEREQIHVGDRSVIEHLDAYTSPRLVEYFDPDPCADYMYRLKASAMAARGLADLMAASARPEAEGVTIEASYTVGEYDILILSAEQSNGLARWLRSNGYRLPDGAEAVLGSYIKQGMRFFVAKVNLTEKSRLGFSYLRPLQIAYESPKFMLPIRLGMLNARGHQELFVYMLTRKGRVETTNYRTVKLPTGIDVPVFVKGEFGDFYTALFDAQVEKESMRTVFTEYAWDMNWCDPCAADPLSPEELRGLGVFWMDQGSSRGQARDVFVTRLHVRYDKQHFPADLVFQQTSDRTNFQGRYVLRHPFRGDATCPAATEYRRQLAKRQEQEAQTLAHLTGWDIDDIRRKIGIDGDTPAIGGTPWWRRIWED